MLQWLSDRPCPHFWSPGRQRMYGKQEGFVLVSFNGGFGCPSKQIREQMSDVKVNDPQFWRWLLDRHNQLYLMWIRLIPNI